MNFVRFMIGAATCISGILLLIATAKGELAGGLAVMATLSSLVIAICGAMQVHTAANAEFWDR